jgi:hypothetical protein
MRVLAQRDKLLDGRMARNRRINSKVIASHSFTKSRLNVASNYFFPIKSEGPQNG